MRIFHDSRDLFYRMPLGAGACGEFVRLRLRAEGAVSVSLRLWWEDQEILREMTPGPDSVWETHVRLPQQTGLLWYYFIARDSEYNALYFGNARDCLGGVGEEYAEEPPSFQITVYRPDFQTPAWMRNGVMMQIMVDRFARCGRLDPMNLAPGTYYHQNWDDVPVLDRANDQDNSADDFFGGNLAGITEKLEFLHDQGITALYLNPIFESPSNHKYNTSDYRKIDPSFGTEEDFRRLCAKAKRLGMRVVLDGVFSHTGDDSLYFNRLGHYGRGGAYNDRRSPYFSWYDFREYPNDYDCWWGFKTLPNVNEEDPSYRQFIISGEDSICAHWLREGASGWRLDVADELPMDFIRDFRLREKRENPEAALIGEVWEDPSNKVAYNKLRCYCTGETLDSCMNYPLREAVLDFLRCRIDAASFVRQVESMRENQPLPFFYAQMNLTGSHDKARALSILADVVNMEPARAYRYPIFLQNEDYACGRRRLIAAWKLLCALPGMPCVYYGDNAGLQGMSDPYCRGTYPWGHEDQVLVQAFRETARKRLASGALRTGTMALHAAGKDIVLIVRAIEGGRDAFGDPAADEHVALAVNRADAPRELEYAGRKWTVPGQSALWLE